MGITAPNTLQSYDQEKQEFRNGMPNHSWYSVLNIYFITKQLNFFVNILLKQ
jgi:hypothetical protein